MSTAQPTEIASILAESQCEHYNYVRVLQQLNTLRDAVPPNRSPDKVQVEIILQQFLAEIVTPNENHCYGCNNVLLINQVIMKIPFLTNFINSVCLTLRAGEFRRSFY